MRFLAQCPQGLEGVLAAELNELGAADVERVSGGALFAAERALSRRILMWARSAVRVLEPVVAGEVESFDQLYELAATARWEDLIGSTHTFSVRGSVSHAPFTDHHFAALRVKDAVVDRIRSRRGKRPNVDRKTPDVPLRIIVRGARASLYRDLAGSSLHRRGHRPIQVRSPLSEAVAAGLLLLTGWTRDSPILDPMCGSGTFLFEAISQATDRAPGLDRSFAAEMFPDEGAALWGALREEARARVRRELGFPLFGSDRDATAVAIAREVAERAGAGKLVRFEVADAATVEPPFRPPMVVSNPPWGGRLGSGEDLVASWRALGTFLRRCPGALAFVLSGDRALTRHLGLRSDRRWPVRIGQFDARWLRYRLKD